MATLYVRKTGNDSNDGSTPALAKLTIGAALTAAANDDTIDIGVGTYSEEVTCGSLTGVIIQGATGRPEDVVITSTTDGASTVKMNTDCILKDLTVKYISAGSPGGYTDTHAITSHSGASVVYHLDNCFVYSNRNGINRTLTNSTCHRVRFIYIGRIEPTCPASGSAHPNLNYSHLAHYNNDAYGIIATSCYFQNWGSSAYRSGGPFINCTVVQKSIPAYNCYGFYSTHDNLVNMIAFTDTGSVATSYAAGCSGDTHGYAGLANNAGIAYNCISHGHSGYTATDYSTGVGEINYGTANASGSYNTTDVEAAGGPTALYVDHTAQDTNGLYNVRIRSGSLAYRLGNNDQAAKPTYDLDGKPFHPTTPSRGCYEYCFGHTASGVSVKRQSGSLGVGSTYIKSMLGVTT